MTIVRIPDFAIVHVAHDTNNRFHETLNAKINFNSMQVHRVNVELALKLVFKVIDPGG